MRHHARAVRCGHPAGGPQRSELWRKDRQDQGEPARYPHGATEEEIAAFKDMHAGLEKGYGGTFDQLAGVLAKA